MLQEQTLAPEFRSIDQNNKTVSLKDFSGKYVVLYFYPKDDTPGCTIEACTLRDNFEALEKYAVVIGVSSDNVESHKAFEEKYNLPFILLADTNKEIIKAYGAKGAFTKRITYIINPKGVIVKAYPKVTPSNHALQILSDLSQLS